MFLELCIKIIDNIYVSILPENGGKQDDITAATVFTLYFSIFFTDDL